MGKKGLRKRPQTPRTRHDFSWIRGLLARWGLTIGVAAWMFVLGVWVGRGTIPVQFDTGKLQMELARLRHADEKVQVRQLERESEALFADAPDLGFHEQLMHDRPSTSPRDALPSGTPEQGAGEGENEGNDPEAQGGEIENKTPLLKKRPQDGGDRRDRIQEENLPVRKPAEAPKPEPEPPDDPKPRPQPQERMAAAPVSRQGMATDGELTVQVASFRNSGDAESLVASLKAKAYPAYKIAGIIPQKGIWHRVRVGRFKDRADAQTMVNRLRRDQHQAFVVQRTIDD